MTPEQQAARVLANCPRYDSDGDPSGQFDHKIFVKETDALAAIAHHLAPVRVKPDLDAIESGGKRWHGEDHRVVSVRWEPYKPDGARQMKAKGRWQEQVGSGDYWRWQNCERPQFLAALEPDAGVAAELVEAHRENARVLSHLHNDLQGRVDATKLAALFECLARSTAALALAHNTTEG